MPFLDIRNLTLHLEQRNQNLRALDSINLSINAGEIHAVVGNTGSGKSLIARSIVGLYQNNWQVQFDRLFLNGKDLQALPLQLRRERIKQETALIFQDPIACLDPSMSIAKQVDLQLSKYRKNRGQPRKLNRKEREQEVAALLHRVGIDHHESVMSAYPVELSLGICQRVMIAMALAKEPKLLIADEPLDALPAQTQAQIMRLLSKANQLNGTSILLFSQDLCSIAHFAHRFTILYCGQIVESGPGEEILNIPRHPYTKALLEASPHHYRALPHQTELPILKGTLPSLDALPKGCRLGPRCPRAQQQCVKSPPLIQDKDRSYRCFFPLTEDPSDAATIIAQDSGTD